MTLNFKETSIKNKETIIFLHSEMLASWIWEEQSKEFSDYHCIMPDLPGHGESQIQNKFTINDSSIELINLIERNIPNKPIHLVGISLGAQVILNALIKLNTNVKSIVLINPIISDYNQKIRFQNTLKWILDSYMSNKDLIFYIKAYLRYYGIKKSNIEKIKYSSNKITDDNLRNIMTQTLLFNLPNNLENNQIPILILAGNKDHIHIKHSVEIIKEKTKNSHAYIVPKMLKLGNMTNTKLFNEILRNWLNEKQLPNNLIPI